MQFVADVENAAPFLGQLLQHHKQTLDGLRGQDRGGLVQDRKRHVLHQDFGKAEPLAGLGQTVLTRRCVDDEEHLAERIRRATHVELLLEPELSILLFRRTGWTHEQYESWSARVLAEGITFTVPTAWNGETCLRLCIVNPETTVKDIELVLETLK